MVPMPADSLGSTGGTWWLDATLRTLLAEVFSLVDPGLHRADSAEFRLGTRRGLDACASPRGTFTVLALYHRQNLCEELPPEAPETTTYDEMVAFKRAVIQRLVSLVDEEGRAWHDRPNDVTSAPVPGDGWYRTY
jgi:hypothetical protein